MDLKDINLNLLVVFNQLLQERRVSAVARTLDLSQPAVSNALKRLRRLLGDELFLPTTRGMQPTPFATQLAEPVAYALATIHSTLNQRASFDPLTSNRNFTIAMSDIGEVYFMPVLMKRLASAAPGVTITTVRNAAVGLNEEMESGKVDLAVFSAARRYAGLTGVPLGEIKLFLVVPPDHPLATLDTVNPRELENHSFIGYEEGSEIRTMMDSYFRRMSLSIEYALESSNVATIKHMVMAGLGLSVLPEMAVGAEIRDGRLVRVDVQGFYMAQKMALYYKTNRTLTPTRKEFLNFMQHELGAERELGVARRAKKE